MDQAKIRSMGQRRAQFAWNYAQEAKKYSAAEKYRSHTLELSMLILNCGLMNALAFAYDKGKVGKIKERPSSKTEQKGGNIGKEEKGDLGWQKLYLHLEKWIKEDSGLNLIPEDNPDLICFLLTDAKKDGGKAIRLFTNEILSLLIWLKRFV